MDLRIVSQNVNGLRDYNKRKKLFYALRQQADILCLQETHSEMLDQLAWKTQWGGPIIFPHGEKNSKGVCICIKQNLEIEVLKSESDPDSRYVICDLKYKHMIFTLVNLYAPNQDNPTFFVKLFLAMQKYQGQKIYIGDFNLVLDPDIDRKARAEKISNNDIATEVVKQHMEDIMLTDIWRERHELETKFTYIRAKPAFHGSRINFILLERALSCYIQETQILPGLFSDHSRLPMKLSPFCMFRGGGMWKLNNKLLTETEYVQQVNIIIDNAKTIGKHLSAQNLIEQIKIDCAEFSKKYAVERANNRRLVMSMLETKLAQLEDEYSYDIFNDKAQDSKINLMVRTRSDLEDMIAEKTEGALLRSKAVWYGDTGFPSRYLLNLDKSRSGAKGMNLLIQGNQEIKDPQKIIAAQYNFYKELYTSDPSIEFAYENDSGIQLTPEEKQSTAGKFQLQELTQALRTSKRGKAPGSDRLTCEFYIVFYDKLKMVMLEAINESFESGKLHNSALCGIISLIPKRNKDTRLVKNLRPISLLNFEYKLIEKMLANRMKPCLESIIHNDQQGFLAKHRISVNVRCILDILELVNGDETQDGFIVSVDFQKAFDRIELASLLKVLEFFNFHEDFIRWMKIIYNGAYTHVCNNGFVSEKFMVTRSVRQGGPNSAYYFLICAEVLAILLRKK